MRTALVCFALIILWLGVFHARAQPHPNPAYSFAAPWVQLAPTAKPPATYPPPRRPAVQAATIQWLVERQDARETWGYNRGPLVDQLILAGGGNPYQKKPPEYCGLTQAADQLAHHLPIPPNGLQAGARYWFTNAAGTRLLPRTIYALGQQGVLMQVQPGDLAGFIWRYQTVIHHITRVAQVVPATVWGRPPRGFWTWGGNEGHGTNAGMHLTYYPGPSIAAIARWDYR